MEQRTARRPWRQRERDNRVYQAALGEGLTPLQAVVLAGRFRGAGGSVVNRTWPRGKMLPTLADLPDIEAATHAVVRAISENQVIAAVCDHDADGQDSAAILFSALMRFGVPASRVRVITSHRLKEGYGVSDKLVERILDLDPCPQLVITADQGSCDEPRIAELARRGIATVVTDHHTLPAEGPPASAVACVNPARSDSRFDPTIAGCMVAWLLMESVRRALACDDGIEDLLEYAAVGTIADCVDLGAPTNRWAVQKGLARISQSGRPIWEAFRAAAGVEEVDSQTVAFKWAPMINSAGRLGDAGRGVAALCANDRQEALAWVEVLQDTNTERKARQKEMERVAQSIADIQLTEGRMGLCIDFGAEGHPGIHGVVAGRVVERSGLPTVCLSREDGNPDRTTGSIRSIEGAHVRKLLDAIAASYPWLDLRYGGHAAAGGVRFATEHAELFAAAWDKVCTECVTGLPPAMLEHDGSLGCVPTLDMVAELAALQPFGRGFPEPRFSDVVRPLETRVIGADRSHLSVMGQWPDGRRERAVWFGAADRAAELEVPGTRWVYRLARSTFRGRTRVDVMIDEVLPGSAHACQAAAA